MSSTPPSIRELRKAAGLSQVDTVERIRQAGIHLSQSALSRAEKGEGRLTAEVTHVLCRIYGVTGAEREALVRSAENAEAGYVDARVVFQAGNTINLQQRFARLERESAEIRSYNPAMILGILQSPAYSAVVFGTSEDNPLVLGRMARQQEMLADPHRRWVLVQTEGALRWQVQSPVLMAEQMDHLIDLSEASNVDFGVVEWRTPVTVFHNTAFHLYDQSAVVVGIRDGTAIITNTARLADYRSLFDELASFASFGGSARDALRRIASEYQAMRD